jgi:hypothetical protein
MKLSTAQIDQLYNFIRQHYVEWYDLQSELVDHLANAIETQWQENPKLSFDEALNKEFQKFGVFGFMDIVGKRQLVLRKKYNQLVWHHFKDFFTIPKIIGTASAIGILFIAFHKLLSVAIVTIVILYLLLSVVFWIASILMSRKNKKQSQLLGKKWLFKDIIYGYGFFGGFSYLPMQFSFHIAGRTEYTTLPIIIISLTIVSSLLFYYIILVIIPSKAEQYLKTTYPEYSLFNL